MPISPVTAGQVAAFLQAQLIGSSHLMLEGAAGLPDAKPSDVSFVDSDAAFKSASSSRAGLLLTHRHIHELRCAQIVVPHPALAMTKVVANFFLRPAAMKGISNLCQIGKDVTFGDHVSIWPFATIDDAAQIGRGTQIYPGVFIGGGTKLGADCLIYPNVTIREGVTIGDRVIIHPGTVIGSDGFGFLQHEGRHHKIPQIGTVVIEDDVELGANVTVDRATFGTTIIRRGTKVDNLVQIAHNVEIGEHNILVAQVGIAGSSRTGHYVVLGGQAGVADHITIGHQVMAAARCGISRDVGDGEIIAGFPAMPHKAWLRSMAALAKLPELRQQLRDIESRLTALRNANSARSTRAKNVPRPVRTAAAPSKRKPKSPRRKGSA
ncbi:MAG TPA: UDP-3-O-(3-hydroxymyristoyl)glucosamine N-acyltransferase [Nitrospirales bacterium]|jgi:UDP-3-O-[3-hydroxymyristoyl] glucosamine N-acyltransferase